MSAVKVFTGDFRVARVMKGLSEMGDNYGEYAEMYPPTIQRRCTGLFHPEYPPIGIIKMTLSHPAPSIRFEVGQVYCVHLERRGEDRLPATEIPSTDHEVRQAMRTERWNGDIAQFAEMVSAVEEPGALLDPDAHCSLSTFLIHIQTPARDLWFEPYEKYRVGLEYLGTAGFVERPDLCPLCQSHNLMWQDGHAICCRCGWEGNVDKARPAVR